MSDSDATPQAKPRRKFLIRGLAALLPTILTIVLMVEAYKFIEHYMGTPLKRNVFFPIAGITEKTNEEGDSVMKDGAPVLVYGIDDRPVPTYVSFAFTMLALLLTLVAFYIAGLLFATFLGNRLVKKIDDLLKQVPVIRSVYPYVKQVTDFFFVERSQSFSQVVAVEYPRRGMYSMGFVTGAGFRQINDAAGEEYINVFIPSSPTPVTGYVIFVPRRDVVVLPISVDNALRFSVSGGVIIPHNQVVRATMDQAITEQRTTGDEDE